MSSEMIDDILNFAKAQLNIYFGLFILITGIFGQIGNILVFTSLKTFRETTCAFYLTIVSIANLGQSFVILLRIIVGFSINSDTSRIVCRLRWGVGRCIAMISIICLCLSTVDQFLSMTKYYYFTSMKLARRYVLIASIISLIHGVIIFIYYDSNRVSCIITNEIFAKYFTQFYLLFVFGIIPLTIITIFSVLAFIKTRSIASRQIQRIRLSRDRQLTAMTLFHGLFTVITNLFYVCSYVYTLNVKTTNAQEITRNQLIGTIASLLGLESYAIPFYIYCCVSKRFRTQLVYVLFGIHLKKWNIRAKFINGNKIAPVSVEDKNDHREIQLSMENSIALY